jgi:molybdopterin synthase sulfur carrier subunit
MATVKLFGTLRKKAGVSRLQVKGKNICSVIKEICKDYPSLEEALLEDGEIRPYFFITLNGHDIRFTDGLDTRVEVKDQIAIFSPIAGGSWFKGRIHLFQDLERCLSIVYKYIGCWRLKYGRMDAQNPRD